MRLVLISDTHNLHHELHLPPGDVLIHAGDATVNGTAHEVLSFMNWFAAQDVYQCRILIAGNHDAMWVRDAAQLEAIARDSGVRYLKDEGMFFGGLTFYGVPWVRLPDRWAFSKSSSKELQEYWKQIPGGTDVLITHMPPHGMLDEATENGMAIHAGSSGLMKAVERVKPKLHVFGHYHEGYGERIKGGVHFVNAASCNDEYRLVHRPIVVDL